MKRPIWVRVLLQPILATVLYCLVLPSLARAQARLSWPMSVAADHAGIGRDGNYILFCLLSALVYAIVGAMAAVLTWLVARTPWDSLGSSALLVMPVLIFGLALSPVVSHTVYRGWHAVATVAQAFGLFAGSGLLAWSLQRATGRAREEHEQQLDGSLLP